MTAAPLTAHLPADPAPTRDRIKGPAPSAWLSHRAMCDLVGRRTAHEAAQRNTTLVVRGTRDQIGSVRVSGIDSWRWNRWNTRWERLGGGHLIS